MIWGYHHFRKPPYHEYHPAQQLLTQHVFPIVSTSFRESTPRANVSEITTVPGLVVDALNLKGLDGGDGGGGSHDERNPTSL